MLEEQAQINPNYKTRAVHAWYTLIPQTLRQASVWAARRTTGDLEQVMVDGTRIRSQGSTSSLRRQGTIEQHLAAARQLVEAMGDEEQAEQQSRRVRAARQRAAREQVERLEQALEELQTVRAKKKSEAEQKAARVSESEPEARLQRESNGGYAAGYNAQLATAAKERSSWAWS